MPKTRPKPLFFIALAAVLAGAGFVFANGMFRPASTQHRDVRVTIPRGSNPGSIARILKRKGLIRSGMAFRLAARAGNPQDIQAGTYVLSPDMTPAAILQALEGGRREVTVRVTFPEGFTLKQIAMRAAGVPGVKTAEFEDLATGRTARFHAPFPTPANLEGYLCPDTYDFHPNTTAKAVIEEMLANFARKVTAPLAPDFRQSAAKGYDLAKIVTLASLIEREAKVKTDQPLIAGVLYNRLKLGMPLQVDATVQYVVGHKERLLYKDLAVASPYNTYKNAGLPPGPICSPGLGAIRAALHPATVKYLYYTARADGTHTFTTTFENHIRATRQARSGAATASAASTSNAAQGAAGG